MACKFRIQKEFQYGEIIFKEGEEYSSEAFEQFPDEYKINFFQFIEEEKPKSFEINWGVGIEELNQSSSFTKELERIGSEYIDSWCKGHNDNLTV